MRWLHLLISVVKELLLKLVEDYYPLPLNPDQRSLPKNGKAAANGKVAKKKRGTVAVPAGTRTRKKPRTAGSEFEPKEADADGAPLCMRPLSASFEVEQQTSTLAFIDVILKDFQPLHVRCCH